MSGDWTQPSLIDELEEAVLTVEQVAPRLFDRAHVAGDVFVQRDGGHFALAALNDSGCRRSTWSFINLGSVLGMATCSIHGNTIDPVRARLLASALTDWADRADAS